MAKTAITGLQQQIEEVRREAFAAGYAAAMQVIRELASRPAPSAGTAPSGRGGGARRGRTGAARPSLRRRRAETTESTARRRRPAARRPQRGENAQRVGEILKSSAPRALRVAEIRKALQEKGAAISFTSLLYALSQLEKRNAVEQVGETRTRRHRGEAA